VLHTFVEATNGRCRAGNKTYCAFIDAKKAYDRVWRDCLWKRLWDSGVQGNVWRLLRAGYVTVKSCVLCDGEQSQWFDSAVGVRQGCVLSPVLYSVFINGFAKHLKKSDIGGIMVGQNKLSLLLFADDIVMFAESVDTGDVRHIRRIL
jgi:hypothetical protein